MNKKLKDAIKRLDSKEPWHTAKPYSKEWKKEDAKEPWHTCKPTSKCWQKQEIKEHHIKIK